MRLAPAEHGLDPPPGGEVVPVDAPGVDPEQDGHAVSGPLGDLPQGGGQAPIKEGVRAQAVIDSAG